MLAYENITKIVAKLLYGNPHAQLFVMGHSLGGAAVYGTMLHYNAETEIADRLAAIYTFGQPRVGDQNFTNYVNQKLKGQYD
jgi:predicted lipase